MSYRLLSVALLFALIPSLGFAQGDRRKQAITDIAKAGADYAVQGEYYGSVAIRCGRRGMGLQVIARGDGKFDAVLYTGGLPGSGWNRQDRVKLTGTRNDNGQVRLSGEGHSVVLTGGAGAIYYGDTKWGTVWKTARRSPSLGLRAPRGALVMFDGDTSDYIQGGKVTDDGYLNVNVGGGVQTKFPVGDFRMHLEFRTPFMPYAKGQGRANSGVYIQRRYEVQILDSFGLDGVANECGGLYRQQAPDLNMCLPPLQWQTYDIYFTAARWSDGKKVGNARITVYHNGVAIHNNREIKAKTGAGRPEADSKMPILFQNHSNPVYLRNVWLVHTTPTRYTSRSAPRRRPLARIFRRLRRR